MKRPATNKINGDGVDFLAGFYDPPLRRYGSPGRNPFQRAKAAAWGEALREWLEGRRVETTRGDYRRAMASLLSFCRRPPWQVRQADAARWLELGLAGKTDGTKNSLARRASQFYDFAQGKSWTSPTGRRLRLCRRNPIEGVERPKVKYQLRVVPLSEGELERLLAAFDRETAFGRRDLALFTLILETGMRLREALKLRLRDVETGADNARTSSGRAQTSGGSPQPAAGDRGDRSAAWEAALEAVRNYLQGEGRLEGMGPENYVFIPLEDQDRKLAKGNSRDRARKPLAAQTAMAALKQYTEWAGLGAGRVSPEILRYTGAMRLVRAGASAQEVGQFLGLKSMQRAWQVRKRLREWEEREQAEEKREPPSSSDPDSPPAVPRRRQAGGQPGNRNRLLHGKKSARFRLKRLGIEAKAFTQVDVSNIPGMLDELDRMRLELDELPDSSWWVAVKKLKQMSYLTYVSGRLIVMYLQWIRKQRDQGD